MARNGSGTYSLPAGNPVVTNTTISSTWANNTLSDIATALTNSIAKDGQTTATANLPMGGFKLTNIAAGTTSTDSARFDQIFNQGAPTDIASASTVDIGGQLTNFLTVTGTTTITSFGTNYKGPKMLKFTGILTLTYDSTTLVIPGAANITTAAGDTAIVIPKSTTSGTADGWQVILYQRASGFPAASGANGDITSLTALSVGGVPNGVITPAKLSQPLTIATEVALTSGTTKDFVIPSWAKRITEVVSAGQSSGTSNWITQIGVTTPETSGYASGSAGNGAGATSTQGFLLSGGGESSTTVRHGHLVLIKSSGNKWVAAGNIARTDAAQALSVGGSKIAAGVIDILRITTANGTDTFTAGSVTIVIEGGV